MKQLTKKQMAEIVGWAVRTVHRDDQCRKMLENHAAWPGLSTVKCDGNKSIFTLTNGQEFSVQVSIPRKS